MNYKEIVESLGCKYVGIQEGYKETPPSVLFNDKTGDTLAVFIPLFSFEAVKVRLAQQIETRALFGR